MNTHESILPCVRHIFETYRRIYNERVITAEDEYDRRLEDGPLQVEGPNEYYGKTTSGYVVEWYYGSPSKVHTPEGQYQFFKKNCARPPRDINDAINDQFIQELSLVLGRSARNTSGPFGGTVGPYYKVMGNKTFVVPAPVSPMLDGLELDSNDKMNGMATLLEVLLIEGSIPRS